MYMYIYFLYKTCTVYISLWSFDDLFVTECTPILLALLEYAVYDCSDEFV